MATVLWFLGLVAFVVGAALASGRGRATPNDVVGRAVILAAAAAYAALVVAAVWLWSGAPAATGRAERLREGAAVDLALRGVRMPLDRELSIGHGAEVAVRIPGAGDVVLARVGIEAGRPARVGVRVGDPQRGAIAAVPVGADPIATATAVAARACSADPGAATATPLELAAGASIVVLACSDDAPSRALVVRRDPLRAELRLSPLAWRGRFVAEHLVVRAGDVLRVGGDDAIPGVTTWDAIAVRGATAMLVVPGDPTACAAWAPEAGGEVRATRDGCEVDTGVFVVGAMPLVPDAARVIERAARAAIAIGVPPLAALLALALARRRGRRVHALGRALRLGVLGVGLVAVAGWRLLWAYRIDVLRELTGDGPRVLANQLAVVGIGAALAGLAAGALAHDRPRRVGWAIAAWAGWAAASIAVVGLDPLPAPRAAVGALAMSLVAAVVPSASAWAGALVARHRLGAELALAGIAAAAVVARFAVPRSALVKLALAYALVLAGHAALRGLLARDTAVVRRFALAVALPAAAVALAALDAGVTLAIAGTGLALAMLVAGHDAMYDASQAERVGMLEREHARLLVVHGAAACALAIGVAAAAVAISDRELVRHGATAILYAPLACAVLFAIAAVVARSHRRGWAPWVCAALAALAVWGARAELLARATAGEHTSARRVSAVVEPGYALLRDHRAFAANVAAWREAALVPTTATATGDDADAVASSWRGQGYFGARVRDPGVARSIDNDYLPVLVAREVGVGGLTQGVALLLVLVVGAGALASVRLRHASREQRARWLITGVAGAVAVYQPLAALGVVPLTGISWPGLGIDSPADLWLFVIGGAWCLLAGDEAARDDERVRGTPRLARARRVVIGALAVCGVCAVVIVARAGACALSRVATDDDRVATALAYADTLRCAWPERTAATLAEVVPDAVAGEPTDPATARYEGELRAAWIPQRAALITALAPLADAPAERPALAAWFLPIGPAEPAAFACSGRAGRWQLARDGEDCTATLRVGWPRIELALRRDDRGLRATCAVATDDDVLGVLRAAPATARAPRIRVVSAAIGAAATDVGELVAGQRVFRLRPGGPARELATAGAGLHVTGKLALADGVALEIVPRGVALRGPAEVLVAGARGGWRRIARADASVLEHTALIVAGAPDRRVIALFRPPRAWAGERVVDPLLADDSNRVGDRARRAYPYGAALPELGWVNPYDAARSLGLDGWIHAAHAPGRRTPAPIACGTLTPPAIARDRVCSVSPLDGVLECRLALQPELALGLRRQLDDVLATPRPHTGRDVAPVRAAVVVLRGDTGELLAQANLVPGRPPLVYAPANPDAEARLIRAREARGESDRERVDWNLPIAVGSTLKPILARAAEQAFPQDIALLALTAAGEVTGCKARRGKAVSPIVGHCPPTPVSGSPTSADLHDFLAKSPNWYQATLGLVGLGLPDARLAVGDTPVSLSEIVGSDLSSWPTERPLMISDASGPILGKRGVSIDGLRRTPLWNRVERLLGRPLCTLGNRARCEREAARADVCAARALPVAAGADLRYLVALGPDRVNPYPDDRGNQGTLPIREYFQLLRGSGVHPIGSLAQMTDAFGRVIYDPEAQRLAASWFPAPVAGTLPAWSCAAATGHAPTVLGADGGLCGVLREGGTAHATAGGLLAAPGLVIYGAKTGTIDSLADIARRPAACRQWNARHPAAQQLVCGKTPPDDSLFVIAFGVVTAKGTVPITLGIQLQRSGAGAAAKIAPALVAEIARYLRGS